MLSSLAYSPAHRTRLLRRLLAFVITDLDVGGAEGQMVELVTRLPRDEFEPHVFVLLPISDTHLADRLVEAGIPLQCIDCRGKADYLRAIRTLTVQFEKMRPGLVQGFLHSANLAAALAAARVGVKPVVTGIRVAERRWNLHRFAARVSDRMVTRHVCVSRSVAEFAQHRVGLTPANLVTIPNGVDADRFMHARPLDPAEAFCVPAGTRLLAYVGRLDRQKRLHWLFGRLPVIFRRLPQHHLLLAGNGPEEARLRRTARRLGIASRVHFVGWRADVARVMATVDLVVLTSAWEGMSNAILEAMAAGKPVVATHVEGMAEVLGPLVGHPGRQLVPRHDSAAFVDAVVHLATDSERARQVGAANQARVRQQFSLERMASSYCQLYRELLAAHPHHGQ